MSAGGKTIWGNPAEVGNLVQGAAFDVVLDNNGKDLETVRSVTHNVLLCHCFCITLNFRLLKC